MRTAAQIVRGHQNLWKPPGDEVWKLPLYRSSEGRTIADLARESEIGTRFRKSVHQEEDDRVEWDDRLISQDTEKLKRHRKKSAELRRPNLTEPRS